MEITTKVNLEHDDFEGTLRIAIKASAKGKDLPAFRIYANVSVQAARSSEDSQQ